MAQWKAIAMVARDPGVLKKVVCYVKGVASNGVWFCGPPAVCSGAFRDPAVS